MPNPYRGGHALWNVDTLTQRPELAMHLGVIAGMWSVIEAQLGHVLATILHSDALVGMTIYSVIKAEGARLDAMDAIASERLSPVDYATFIALQKAVRSVGKQRDVLMHNIWAVSEAHPKSLVLHDVRKWTAFAASSRAENQTTNPDGHKKIYDAMIASSMEYKEQDFLAIQRDVKALYFQLLEFAMRLGTQGQQPANESRPPTNTPLS